MKWLTVLAAVIVLTGCRGKQKSSAQAPAPVPQTALSELDVDTVGLRTHLVLLADQTSAQISGTTTQIARSTNDPRIQEQTILFKLRSIPVMYNLANHPDARAAFVYSWMFSVRMLDYLTDGEGRTLFGDGQPLIVKTAQDLMQSIMDLGYQFFPKAVMDEVHEEIDELADANPMGAAMGTQTVTLPANATEQQRGAIDAILGAPVRGLEGVGSTPEAIQAVWLTIENLMNLIRQMPQFVRWQTELLLLQTESQQQKFGLPRASSPSLRR